MLKFFKKKRNRMRSKYETQVKIISNEKIITSYINNISLNGAYLETDSKVPIGSDCFLEFELPATDPAIILQIEGKIIRVDDRGLGVLFNKMDVDTFGHLKQIVINNSSDPETIFEECSKKPGFK